LSVFASAIRGLVEEDFRRLVNNDRDIIEIRVATTAVDQ